MLKNESLKNFIEEIIDEVQKELEEATTTASVDGYQTPFAFSGGRKKDKKKKDDIINVSGGYKRVDESIKKKKSKNRWLELKNDESMHAHKKLAVGLKELKYQLSEVEKFFTWYNKIKNINELDSSDFWKRTNGHIYKIKERIINIAKTLKEIEK